MITMHDPNIEQVFFYKYLGVQIEWEISWHEYVTGVCAKIHQHLFSEKTEGFWDQSKYYVDLLYS